MVERKKDTLNMTSTNFDENTTAEEIIKYFNVNLDGKVIFITGATSGKLNYNENKNFIIIFARN